jgi:hypothetical protein
MAKESKSVEYDLSGQLTQGQAIVFNAILEEGALQERERLLEAVEHIQGQTQNQEEILKFLLDMLNEV